MSRAELGRLRAQGSAAGDQPVTRYDILPTPFAELATPRTSGVYLHWSLPDALTHADADGDTATFPRRPIAGLFCRHFLRPFHWRRHRRPGIARSEGLDSERGRPKPGAHRSRFIHRRRAVPGRDEQSAHGAGHWRRGLGRLLRQLRQSPRLLRLAQRHLGRPAQLSRLRLVFQSQPGSAGQSAGANRSPISTRR